LKGFVLNNLVKRVLVGVIGIPIFITLVLCGSYYFFALILMLSNLCLWEYFNIATAKQTYPLKVLSYIMNTFMLSILFFTNSPELKLLFVPLSIIGILSSSILHTGLNLWNKNSNNTLNIAVGQSSFNYISLFFGSLLLISNFGNFSFDILQLNNSQLAIVPADKWSNVVLAFFVAIWSSDTFAYFVGSAIGKHRLFERISPKKSWEGAIAGFFGSMLGFYLITHFTIPSFPLPLSICLGAIIGIIGTIGDLAESQLKRDAGIKDSSNIIPGHGGILDRFDSILFTAPVVLIVLIIYSLI